MRPLQTASAGVGRAASLALSVALAVACGDADDHASDTRGPADADASTSDVATPADAHDDAGADAGPDGCAPACPLTACGADDGCGGSCAACPSGISCADCALRLEATATDVRDGVVRRLSLALVYDPPAGAPGPTTAEIRLGISGPARVIGLTEGAAIAAADKTLAPDTTSGEPYRVEADGTVRIVVVSDQTVQELGAGTLWTYEVLLGGAFEAPTAPVELWLRRADDPLFAPPAADAVIADPRTQDPVAVWPGAPL